MRARSDDLPALGRPTSAASASSFRRSSICPSSPGMPISANRGVCRVAFAKRLLPRPPDPPVAELLVRPEAGEVAPARVRDEHDVAALPTVAAVRTALRHELLAAEVQ